MDKDDGAMLTIGELSAELGLPTHILRYWETKFTELRPLQRSGNRRYYRPADVALAKRINELLNTRGFTIKGAQKELRSGAGQKAPVAEAKAAPQAPPPTASAPGNMAPLRAIRRRLAEALAAA
ncbi:MerR family transcriptional regulator [Sphingorhabdus soli]|uniref:MerR family transcriptional regulator n=1 Tax=Flavisphingopyxis soli TaxID=2601267 RepID=A0A5C6UN12_9SPHN|nr:MerR family transcriptional regulator [Sphingorhabdus soli]TXC74437.1 MerR family transcriptional regulator [Sphingorhabdus soli]